MASEGKQWGARHQNGAEQKELLHHIGGRLRTLREARGISRTRAAAAIGLSVQAYSNREAGATEVKAFEVVILADLLGVGPADLFAGAEAVWSDEARGWGPEGDPVHAAEAEEFLRQLNRIRDPNLRRDVTDAIKALARAVTDTG